MSEGHLMTDATETKKTTQCHFSAERGCLSFKTFLLNLDNTLKKPHEKYVNSGWDQRAHSGGYNSSISC